MQPLTPTQDSQATRRSVLRGIGLFSILSFLSFGWFSKKKDIITCAPEQNEKKTMKFLTQDGQLVEVDISKITSTKDKASNKEMQEWVKR